MKTDGAVFENCKSFFRRKGLSLEIVGLLFFNFMTFYWLVFPATFQIWDAQVVEDTTVFDCGPNGLVDSPGLLFWSLFQGFSGVGLRGIF